MLNALTVDLEEWFHVCGAERHLPRSRWGELPHRARGATERLLELLDGTRATFFVLGYVAERDPGLVRRVAEAGHEVASHGWGHERVDRLSADAFRRDVRRSVEAIGEACGVRPRGYRAPEWSIGRTTPWALEVLAEEGFEFDSSYMPWFGLPSRPHRAGGLWELPASTLSVLGRRVPVLNGTAIRLLPTEVLSGGIARLNAAGVPANLAFHPWELDGDFPWTRLPIVRGALHYISRRATAGRVGALLRRHAWGPVSAVLRNP